MTKFGRLYQEFKGVRTTDLFSLMVSNFPIFLIRKLDFDLDVDPSTVYVWGIFGFSFSTKPKRWHVVN